MFNVATWGNLRSMADREVRHISTEKIAGFVAALLLLSLTFVATTLSNLSKEMATTKAENTVHMAYMKSALTEMQSQVKRLDTSSTLALVIERMAQDDKREYSDAAEFIRIHERLNKLELKINNKH